jgi:hypothetical protein
VNGERCGPATRTATAWWNTGEQGEGLALAGLILGWAAVILGILFVLIAVGVAMSAGMHGTMH